MKIRDGFVSNSSSSSYVIRGARIKKIHLIKALNVDPENHYELSEQFDKCWRPLRDKCLDGLQLAIHDTHNPFGGDDTDDFILGINRDRLEDGEVRELPDTTKEEDDAIIEAIAKLGIEAGKLSTFVQYVSNDNY